MPRTSPMSKFSKDLVSRLFFLFPDVPDAAIAEKVGVVRQVVQGWRSGKSRPTLDQLETIVKITGVDWQWLMTGKTESIDVLFNIYFPEIPKNTFKGRYENFEYTRINLVGSVLAPWGGPSALPDLVHAIAVTWQSAVDMIYPDILGLARNELGNNFNDPEYIKFARKYSPSDTYASKTCRLVNQIRDSRTASQMIAEFRETTAYAAGIYRKEALAEGEGDLMKKAPATVARASIDSVTLDELPERYAAAVARLVRLAPRAVANHRGDAEFETRLVLLEGIIDEFEARLSVEGMSEDVG